MTAPERLSTHLVSIQLSRRRAPARNAEVHSNSDHDCHDSRSKIQSGSVFPLELESALLEPSLPDLAAPYRSSAAY